MPLSRSRRHESCELAWLFLKLGTTAFGGPAAHIAMMEDEVVRRRRWLTREQFLDLLGATSLIPGRTRPSLQSTFGTRASFAALEAFSLILFDQRSCE